ncbi:MAG: RidA family protein [Phycisphaerales bacterium]|jgi:enamine deaminase RidA (YjgF/YER057c/UK114 family)|nr:RidA family protein [Phycisphaerales bacterium]
MVEVIQRINELGLELPTAPSPVANYVPARICGNELRTSGQIPTKDGKLVYRGSVPSSQSVEEAASAAKLCGLNAISVASSALEGNLDRIDGVLQLRVFVASDLGFEDHSIVANGVSDLMVDIFGDCGRHTRVAMGTTGLPLGATVEVEVTFSIGD